MNSRSLLIAAAALCAALNASAATGTMTSIKKIPSAGGAVSIPTYSGTIAPDGGGAAIPFMQISGMGIDLSKAAAGTRVEYVMVPRTTFGGYNLTCDITKIIDASAPAPAPAPAAATPTGTVKTYDAATRLGTVTPSAGGADLVFVVNPGAVGTIKVGTKVTCVQVVVTGVAP